MSGSRHYDTVAFDVRDNATMLFFARTTAAGDIEDYLLLMRAEGDDLDDAIYIEINENQLAGHDLIFVDFDIDRDFRREFHQWLTQIWKEKDERIEAILQAAN